jgi:hypothetical protein
MEQYSHPMVALFTVVFKVIFQTTKASRIVVMSILCFGCLCMLSNSLLLTTRGFLQFSAIAFYIVYPWFFSAYFTILFAVTVLLLALDFWTVKNVSGRLLVGLRWWNEINEDGESMWHYESLDQQGMPVLNQKDSWLFWWSLYITPVVWLALGLLTLIRFQFIHLLVVGVALIFNIANIIGFTKCRKDATKQIQAFATQTVGSRMANSLQEYLV